LTVARHPEQAALLTTICEGPQITGDELPSPTAEEQAEPKISR